MNRIVELSSIIAENTKKVDDFFRANDLPTPSLAIGAPAKLLIPEGADDTEAARVAVIEAAAELRDMMCGPLQLLRGDWTEKIALDAILRFNLPKTFPVGEQASFEDIARASGVDVNHVRRLLRLGMTEHLFCEPRTGFVAHTALTQHLATNESLHNYISTSLAEFRPAGAKAVDAIAKWPGSGEPDQTGWSLAHCAAPKSMWEAFRDDPVRGERFGRFMGFVPNVKGNESHYLLDNYPWNTKHTVVDVGGGHGQIATTIAERFPNVRCIVQDLPGVVEAGEATVPLHLADRITFMAHDILTPQPIVGADVYYLRNIFHNWSDQYCIKILRNLIPALQPGASIVINDVVIPKPGTLSPTRERDIRAADILMLQLLNAQERETEEFESLFSKADARFKYVGAWKEPDAKLSIIEARWEG